MSMGSALLRAAVALFLSVPAFLGYAYYLSASVVETVAFDPSPLSRALDKADAYNRIHETNLLQGQFEDILNSLVGEFVVDQADRIELQQEILPPNHLKIEVERNLEALAQFMRFDRDVLEASVDLVPSMDRVKAALFGLLDRRIDRAGVETVENPAELAKRILVPLQSIAEGRIPVVLSPMPLDRIDPVTGRRAYAVALEELEASLSVPAPVVANLSHHEAEILAVIDTGDLRQGLKIAAHAAAEPRIDGAILDLRWELDSGSYFDLVDRLAEEVGTRDKVVQDAEAARTWLRLGTWLGPWLALAVTALATIAMGLVFTPFVAHMLRWPCLSLFISGLEFFVLGIAMSRNLLGFVSYACGESAATCTLIADVGSSLSGEVGSSLFAPSAVMMVLGLIGIVASFAMERRHLQPSAVGQPLAMPDEGEG